MTDAQILFIALANIPTALLVLVGIILEGRQVRDFIAEFRGPAVGTNPPGSMGGTGDALLAQAAKNHREALTTLGGIEQRLGRRLDALGQRRPQ